MDKITGSMEALNAMQLTADTAGLDAECKTLLRSKEVLAVILQGTVEEYKGYNRKEIIEFIEADSMSETKEVSPGRTNTQVRGDSAASIIWRGYCPPSCPWSRKLRTMDSWRSAIASGFAVMIFRKMNAIAFHFMKLLIRKTSESTELKKKNMIC